MHDEWSKPVTICDYECLKRIFKWIQILSQSMSNMCRFQDAQVCKHTMYNASSNRDRRLKVGSIIAALPEKQIRIIIEQMRNRIKKKTEPIIETHPES